MADRRTVFSNEEVILFSPDLPPSSWVPRNGAVGGRLEAASGVRSAYAVRRDRLVDLTLRLWETEWLPFLSAMQVLQEGGSFDWFPTADEVESYRVTLYAPMPGQQMTPSRVSEFPRVFTVTITLRGVGDVIPWRPFFGA